MRNLLKSSLLSVLVLALVFNVLSAGDMAKVDIKTSAKCEGCKEKIEKAANEIDGVEKSDLNLETKIVTVKYHSSKTNPDKIRHAIADAGFNADDVKASKEGCCDGDKHTKAKKAGGCSKHCVKKGCSEK